MNSDRSPSALRLFRRAALVLAFAPPAIAHADAPAPSDPPALATAVPGGLTADQVAERAVRTSHDVEARGAERRSAEASVAETRGAFLPRLTGVARYTRLSPLDTPSLGTIVVAPGAAAGPVTATTPLVATPLSFPVPENQYTTQATLALPLSDWALRLPGLTAAARGNAEAARRWERAASLRIAADARTAYYGWVRAKLEHDVALRSLAQLRGQQSDVQAAERAGTASRADLLRVDAQVAGAESFGAHTDAQARIAEEQLRVLMHDDAGDPYRIGEDLDREAATDPAPAPDVHALLAEAASRRWEPRAVAATIEATRGQARAALAAALPRLDAVGNATYANPNQRIFPLKDEFRGTWDASLQLAWTPTDAFSAAANRRGALERAAALEAQRAALLDGIRVEVTRAVEALREADTALASSARGLAAAEESYRVRRLLFQNGRATTVELTDAEVALLRARLDAIAARIGRRVAEVQLAHAAGHDVEDRPPARRERAWAPTVENASHVAASWSFDGFRR